MYLLFMNNDQSSLNLINGKLMSNVHLSVITPYLFQIIKDSEIIVVYTGVHIMRCTF